MQITIYKDGQKIECGIPDEVGEIIESLQKGLESNMATIMDLRAQLNFAGSTLELGQKIIKHHSVERQNWESERAGLQLQIAELTKPAKTRKPKAGKPKAKKGKK